MTQIDHQVSAVRAEYLHYRVRVQPQLLSYRKNKVFSSLFFSCYFMIGSNSNNSRWSSWLWHPAVIVNRNRVVPGSIPGLEILPPFWGPPWKTADTIFFFLPNAQREKRSSLLTFCFDPMNEKMIKRPLLTRRPGHPGTKRLGVLCNI